LFISDSPVVPFYRVCSSINADETALLPVADYGIAPSTADKTGIPVLTGGVVGTLPDDRGNASRFRHFLRDACE
jgi:hypothetical protein